MSTEPNEVLRGARFSLLTVVRFSHSAAGKRYWSCACECGRMTVVKTGHLRSGNTTSCGCAARAATSSRNRKHGHARRGAKSPEYVAWEAMHRRCNSPSNSSYANYGGRGITVCDEWVDDFTAFYEHVGPKPTPLHSIDRIDNDGNYEPGNVRWATRREQRLNQRPAASVTESTEGAS